MRSAAAIAGEILYGTYPNVILNLFVYFFFFFSLFVGLWGGGKGVGGGVRGALLILLSFGQSGWKAGTMS